MMTAIGTPIYHRFMASHGDEHEGINRKVWDPTPWILDVFTGDEDRDDRMRRIMDWCREIFGEESSPIHGRAGRWHRGGATIDGWTWFGFATAADMAMFQESWPENRRRPVP
jgi:hypothetical protein